LEHIQLVSFFAKIEKVNMFKRAKILPIKTVHSSLLQNERQIKYIFQLRLSFFAPKSGTIFIEKLIFDIC